MKTHKNIKGLFLAGLLTVSSALGGATVLMTPNAYAAGTYTWSGGGSDSKFSTAANWQGGQVPTDGATLVFPCQPSEAGADPHDLTNDLSGVKIAAINAPDHTWVESCSRFVIDTVAFQPTVLFDGGQYLYETTNRANVYITDWSGIKNLTVDKMGVDLGLGGQGGKKLSLDTYSIRNMLCGYSGDITSKSTTVGTDVGLSPWGMGNMTFTNGGRMGIGIWGSSTPLSSTYTFEDGSSIGYPSGCVGGGGSEASTVTISGTVVLNGTIPYTLGSNTTVIITGTLKGKGKLVPSADNKGTLINKAKSNTTGTAGGTLSKVTAKTTKLDGSKPKESVEGSNKETLILNGTRDSVIVSANSTLKGNGKASSIFVAKDGVIAPGMSPGCLTTGSLYLDGIYEFELGGLKACSEYDQIKVTGTVSISASAQLKVFGYGNFIQKKGGSSTIIDNQGKDPASGTFKGLPEGTTVKIGKAEFTISYKGGTGNDVVLTAKNSVKLPGVPNTGIAQLVSANPFMVIAATVVAAGALLVAMRKARQ